MNSVEKLIYQAPTIECIVIDNEIALILQSIPPVGPSESFNQMDGSEFYNSIPTLA